MIDERLDPDGQLARRQRSSGFFSSHKIVVFVLWMGLIGGYLYYVWQSEMTFVQALGQISSLLHSPYGPVLYVLLFVLRSLLFFSAGILSIAGGIIFGSGAEGNIMWSFIYVMLGTVLSALISFGIARFFGGNLVDTMAGLGQDTSRLAPYVTRLRRNGFLTVLLMRLLLLPFDPINYLAGFMRVGWRSFSLATILGILPTAFAFVSFGAAIDMQALAAGKMPQFNFQMISFAIVILIFSLLFSRWYASQD